VIIVFSLPQDRQRVEPIIDALVESDLTPWWENGEPGGRGWRSAIAKAADARCIIFCWSSEALTSAPGAKAFRDFADKSCKRQQAIGVLLDDIAPPDLFACTCYDLSGWRAAPTGWRKWLIRGAYLRDIVAAAKSKQSGRDPPPPSAPRKLLLRQLATVSAAILLPLTLITTVLGFWSDFRDLAGFDQMASSAEQQAWNALPTGDCAALRSFVRRFEDGAYRGRAEALLQAAEVSVKKHWRPLDIPSDIYVPHEPASNEGDARNSAIARAMTEAVRRCEALAETGSMRLLNTRVTTIRQNCKSVAGEALCDWRGEAICMLEEPVEVEVKTCASD
jgi:hypothetical protein